MTEHALAQEQIASYLADGLDAAERTGFEAHLAACEMCARGLDEARALDDQLNTLFASERPRAGLSDRMIRGLRTPASVPVRRPMSLGGWIAVGAAATFMVGVLGAGMVAMIEQGESVPGAEVANARVYRDSQLESPAESGNTTPVLSHLGDGENAFGPLRSQKSPRLLTADERAKQARERVLASITPDSDKRSAGDKKAMPHDGLLLNVDVSATPGRNQPHADRVEEVSVPGPISKNETVGIPTPPITPPPPVVGAVTIPRGPVPGKDHAFDPFRANREEIKAKDKLISNTETKTRLVESKGEPKAEPRPEKKPAEAPPEKKDPENEPAPAPITRKIIRTGEIEFEVDSFDTSVERITKIASEEKGFIATINSQKLENGKVRGSVVVRCPPERLDTLLLKLRALGDLKTQRIGSRDVGKEFTDTESELKANRAMEQRFLDIIKNGKGEIKDLIQAEKQLGEYRAKIERLEGELRYLSNQVALSTLTISLTEREIRAAAGITESSTMNLGLEVEDVDKAQQATHAAVLEAKGRILRSELKQNGPGMFEAIVKFQVPPEQVATVREKLVKLGTIMRQDVGRKYEAEGGTERIPNTKVTREDAVFQVSLLNSANFAPRERVELQLACTDAEGVYRAVLERANKVGARIVSQAFDRQPNDQSQGTVRFEVKTAEADAVIADLKALGEVMRLQVVENADPGKGGSETLSQAKRGFVVQLLGMGTTLPRETATIQAATRDVPASFKSIKDAAIKARARILNATLNEQDRQNVSAQIDIEIRRADESDLSAALAATGDIISRTIQRAADNQPNIIDSKIQWRITLVNQVNIKPREVWTLAIEVPNVDQTASEFSAAVLAAKGRTIDTSIDHQRNGQVTARLVFDVPFDQAASLADKFRAAGSVRLQQAIRNPQVPEGSLSIARIDVTLSNALLIVPSDQGLGLTMRKALSYSLTALSYVLMFLVMGLIVVVPMVAVGLGIRWTVLKLRGPMTTPVAATPPAAG